jgi:hypothetical protein
MTPVRVNSKGNIECMSSDGKTCLWSTDPIQCNKNVKSPVSNLVPVECSCTNYTTPSHWCAVTNSLINLNKSSCK